MAALEKKVAKAATPRIVPPGAMVLQPSDERRKSGSHYTPRSLTEPIVRTTLRPILERLGESPKPEQILDLKVCDPAMGSGAFLVEACRQLGDELVKAWHAHDCVPTIPPDEDELLHARRIVAQRCLYGVDKNPMAVDLAKLSLWLATLAKEHPFTFLDHALRHGDSLVGLTKAQILGFHWKPEKQRDFARAAIEGQLNRAMEQRRQIREAPDGTSDALLREKLQAADGFLDQGRRYGDLVVSAFFAADNDRKRKERLESLADDLAAQRSQYDVARHDRLEAAVSDLRGGTHAIVPFHWEIEFPEVFDRENPGFDAFVGNPPFLRARTRSPTATAMATSTGSRLSTRSRTATPTSSPTSSAGRSICFGSRELRPDRHEHDRPGRHTEYWPALDLHARRDDLRTRRVARSGQARRRWSSAWSTSHKGPLAGPFRPRRHARFRSSRPISSTPAGTTTRRSCRPMQARAFRAA